MFEKRLKAVPPQLLTSSGTSDGYLTLVDTSLFKVKQHIVLQCNTLIALELEIKSIESSTSMTVGPRGGSIDLTTNISLYTTALNANIFAHKQPRPKVPEHEIERHTYEEEPVVARRVIVVDKLGDKIDSKRDVNGINRLAVDADISIDSAEIIVDYPNKLKINNLPLAIVNNEYSFTLMPKTDRYSISCRDGAAVLHLSTDPGDTSSIFATISRGSTFNSGTMDLELPTTIYLSANKANVIVEILNWYFI